MPHAFLRAMTTTAVVGLAAAAAGCLTDTVAPAPPVLDALRTRTSLPALRVSGVAEYNAIVTVTGGRDEVTTTADALTGRFAIDVALADGDNDLKVLATDAADNTSDAAALTVVREPARAEVVRVTLPRTTVSADDGSLEVVVDVQNDEPEVGLQTLGVTLSIPEDDTFAPVPVAVNDTGRAVVVLDGRRAQGTFTLRAQADVASLDGTRAFDQAGFAVVPGRPASVDVALSATVDGAVVGPADAIVVPAGTTVDVDVVVADAHDNVIPATQVAIDAPGAGATVVGDRIVGLVRAGTFTVVADTGAGLVAGTATLTVTAADADHVELTTDTALAQAGTPVRAVARVVDRFGNVVADTVPTLAIDAPQAFGAPLVDGGIATASVTVTLAGSYTITASDPASAATPAVAPLQVVAADAVNADFIELDPAGLPYRAGAPVRVNYGFVDAFGNENTSTPLVVTVNAPNVAVVDTGAGVVEISGIVRAGTYVIRGRAAGTGLADDLETLVVGPNPEAAGFNLVLSAALTAEFGTVVFNGADGFGNPIDEAGITTTFSDPTAVTRNGNELTFGRAGSFSVTACLTGTTSCDTEFIAVQGLLDTLPPTATIELLSPLAGSSVARQQRVVFGVALQDDRALSSVSFVATFGDNGNCRTSGGPILFSGSTSESVTFSFSVQGCAIPGDVVNIVVQASDQTGNARNVADESLQLTNPFTLTFPGAGADGGFVSELVAFEGSLESPAGIAVQPRTQTYVVAEAARDRAVGIATDRVQFDLRDQQGDRFALSNVRGAACSAAGNLFFGVDDAGGSGQTAGLVRIRADLVEELFVDNTTPGGQSESIGQDQLVTQVTISEPPASTGVPAVVCMTINAQDHVYCYGNLDAVPAAAARRAEVELGNGLRPRGIAIDGPDAAGDADVLFAALDGNTRVVRPFAFNATRTTLAAVPGGDIALGAFVTGANELGDLVVGPGPDENLYLAHRSRGRILKIDRRASPPVVSVFAEGFASPTGLAFDRERQALLVTDDDDRVVHRIVADPANPGSF
jgi:hypothetical protein